MYSSFIVAASTSSRFEPGVFFSGTARSAPTGEHRQRPMSEGLRRQPTFPKCRPAESRTPRPSCPVRLKKKRRALARCRTGATATGSQGALWRVRAFRFFYVLVLARIPKQCRRRTRRGEDPTTAWQQDHRGSPPSSAPPAVRGGRPKARWCQRKTRSSRVKRCEARPGLLLLAITM